MEGLNKMVDESLILRFLFDSEVHYQNIYISALNNFYKFQNHEIADFFLIYKAELEFKLFKKFSDDIIKLIEIGNR